MGIKSSFSGCTSPTKIYMEREKNPSPGVLLMSTLPSRSHIPNKWLQMLPEINRQNAAGSSELHNSSNAYKR
jgi:hypothetical protein